MSYYLRIVVFICLILYTWVSTSRSFGRTWMDRQGRQLEADYVSFQDGKVTVKRQSDGKLFVVSLEALSDADQQFVKSQDRRGAKDAPVTGPVPRAATDHPVDTDATAGSNTSEGPNRPSSDLPPVDWKTKFKTADKKLAINSGMSQAALEELVNQYSGIIEKLPKDNRPTLAITHFGHSADLRRPNAIVWGSWELPPGTFRRIDQPAFSVATVGYPQKGFEGKNTMKWVTTFATNYGDLADLMGIDQTELNKAVKMGPHDIKGLTTVDEYRFILGQPKSPVLLTVLGIPRLDRVRVCSADAPKE